MANDIKPLYGEKRKEALRWVISQEKNLQVCKSQWLQAGGTLTSFMAMANVEDQYRKIRNVRANIKGVPFDEETGPTEKTEEVVSDFDDPTPITGSPLMFSDVYGRNPPNVDDFPVASRHEGDPTAEKDFFFLPNWDQIEIMEIAIAQKSNVFFHGPPGTGKSTTPKYFALKHGLPYKRVQIREDLPSEELFGHVSTVLENGQQVLKGIVKNVGIFWQQKCVLVLDEIDRIHPSGSFTMQAMIERGGELRLQHMEGDVVIPRHPECYLFFTGNTTGGGENMEMYSASNLDRSFLDRMNVKIFVDYHGTQDEMKMVKHFSPLIRTNLAKQIVQFGQKMRQSWKKGELSYPFTPRTLQTVCELTQQYKNPLIGIKYAFMDGLPEEEERKHAEQVAFSIFGSKYKL